MVFRHMQRNAPAVLVHSALALCTVFALAFAIAPRPAAARERLLLDPHWRFTLGDHPEAAAADFNDADWRTVNLPHDWSIEGATAADAPSGAEGGYFPTGIGWYRRTFTTPDAWKRQLVTIEFEGVYQRATVWLNGHELGKHAYGYTPFSFDLTPHLNRAGQRNVLAIRVDNSAQPNCRWYSGSGIYRHVWLEAVNPRHLVREDLDIRIIKATSSFAEVALRCSMRNRAEAGGGLTFEAELLDPDGRTAATSRAEGFVTPNSSVSTPEMTLEVASPQLWSPDDPQLYTLVTRFVLARRTVDELRTPIGIRTVKVTPERGFELNGQPFKLFGGCIHHDNGPLGAAAFDRAEVRRVELLKSAGFNAIRTSHNPPSVAFLNACDRLGMLVVDEAFDGWAKAKKAHDYHESFAADWQADLSAMIRRDRNHPSVVIWSIGNEMNERGEPSGAKIAADLRAAVLALDATRPIIAACNGLGDDAKWPNLDPLFAALDVAGYNYELDRIVDDQQRVPGRVAAITESFQSEAFAAWDLVDRAPNLIGEFVWTAMDYFGEAGIGRVWSPGEKIRQHWEGPHFPWHGGYCGDIDITGQRKPISHQRNIIWNRGEMLDVAVTAPSPSGEPWQPSLWALPPAQPSWTWPAAAGRKLDVVVTTRHPAVRLYLNDQLLGQQATGREQQFRATFQVPYAPGTLRAVGLNSLADDATEVETLEHTTAGAAAQIRLTADRGSIAADGQDLAFVTVEIIDAAGRLRPDAAAAVQYRLTGPATIAGIGSGDLTSTEPYHANPRRTFQGRALVVLRTGDEPGEISLTAESPDLAPATVVVKSTAAPQ